MENLILTVIYVWNFTIFFLLLIFRNLIACFCFFVAVVLYVSFSLLKKKKKKKRLKKAVPSTQSVGAYIGDLDGCN